MADYSTQAPVPTRRSQLPLEDILISIAIILSPMAALALIITLITSCAELIENWIKPYLRTRRAEQSTPAYHELDNLDTAPGHHTI